MKKPKKYVQTYDDDELSKQINLRKIFVLIFRMFLTKPVRIPIPITTDAEDESYDEKHSDNPK